MIEEVLPRTTVIQRPAVANVDQLIVVSACTQPDPQLLLMDKLLVLAESRGLHPIVCLNKIDLVADSVPEELAAIYRQAAAGAQVLCQGGSGDWILETAWQTRPAVSPAPQEQENHPFSMRCSRVCA